jgi:hypothetical protein
VNPQRPSPAATFFSVLDGSVLPVSFIFGLGRGHANKDL